MNSSELRLGNYIALPNGQIILFDKLDELQSRNNEPSIEGVKLNLITGIPLTLSWLVKLGFVSEENYLYKDSSSDVKFRCQTFDDSPFICEYNNDNVQTIVIPMDEILYVHQFQNYYYDKTKEELVIKQ